MPADLHGAGYNVRAVGGTPCGLGFFAPAPFKGKATEHGGFAGAYGGAADGTVEFGCVPQICQDANTTPFDLRCCGVFVLVDHVLIDGHIHQTMNFRLHPCLPEGGQVLACVAIHEQFIADEGFGYVRAHLAFGKAEFGHRNSRRSGRIEVGIDILRGWLFLNRHLDDLSSSCC